MGKLVLMSLVVTVFYLRVGKTYSVVNLHMRRIDSAEGLFHVYLGVLLANVLMSLYQLYDFFAHLPFNTLVIRCMLFCRKLLRGKVINKKRKTFRPIRVFPEILRSMT